MSYTASELAAMVTALEQSKDYHVLYGLIPRNLSTPPGEATTRRGQQSAGHSTLNQTSGFDFGWAKIPIAILSFCN